MERIDPAKAAAVWQRVHNSTPPAQKEQTLLALIQDEMIDATLYSQLARQFSGSKSSLLQQMAKQEQEHAACLRGIYAMTFGTQPPFQQPKLASEPADMVLRRCYGREMHCLAQYETHSNDPAYGKIFLQLARQEQEHCRHLLELLGGLKLQTGKSVK